MPSPPMIRWRTFKCWLAIVAFTGSPGPSREGLEERQFRLFLHHENQRLRAVSDVAILLELLDGLHHFREQLAASLAKSLDAFARLAAQFHDHWGCGLALGIRSRTSSGGHACSLYFGNTDVVYNNPVAQDPDLL